MNKIIQVIFTLILLFMHSNLLYAEELNSGNYSQLGKTKGVVLAGINWSRQWKCGEFENAQLIKLGFTNIPKHKNDRLNEQLIIETPSKLTVKPEFLTYGYLVEPGKYALTEFSVKVAKSVSDVGYISADKNKLMVNGEPTGGTFSIEAGEVIYIGHFFLDCYKEPIPWRYYPEGKEAFNSYIKSVKSKFKYLGDANIVFRILDTNMFGNPYELQ